MHTPQRQSGFTIVELLIVVVVIGILAAITIVAYSGIARQAEVAGLRSELSSAGKKLENYKTTHSAYPSNLTNASLAPKDSVQYSYTYTDTTYCLQATPNRVGAGSFHITQDGQVSDGACAQTVASCFAFATGTGTITDYYDNQGNNVANPACPRSVVIPSQIGGVTVTTIGNSAFNSNQLTSVSIPNSVTTIGNIAFTNNQLTSVNIPNSLTSAGERAFANNQLTSVVIPRSLTIINNWLFDNNQLTSITIPDSVTSIGSYALRDNQLTSVSIPSSVTAIGPGVLNNNQLPDSQAFIYTRNSNGADDTTQLVSYGGAKRSEVVIPSSVTRIRGTAFASSSFNSMQLTSITIPSSVTTIDSNAFSGNPSIVCNIPTGKSFANTGCATFTYY